MADTKISALTAATTPLAGTEVLPVVQSGTTKKVAVGDLTAGRAVSAASVTTTGDVVVGGNLDLGWPGSAPYKFSLYESIPNGAAITYNNSGKWTINNSQGVANNPNGLLLVHNFTGGDFSVAEFGSEKVDYFNNNSGYAYIKTYGTNAITISNTQNVTVSAGNLVIGTSGKGIDFSANTHAAGMTSELLNAYEEGTFTPYFTASSGDPTVTYTTQAGRYTKVGRLVFIQIDIVVNTASGGSGNLSVAGLPFTNGAINGGLSNAFVYNFVNDPTAYFVPAGSDTVALYRGTSTNTQNSASDLQAGAFLRISGSYSI